MTIKHDFYTSKIIKVIEENYRVKTFEIDHNLDCKPGQFLMIWMPGIGEKPMSIGNNNPLTISVANVGEVSAQITKLKEGDTISYRGPFGNPFIIPKDSKKILCVGGGYGVVPMYFLSKIAKENGIQSAVVIGARNQLDLIFEKQLFLVSKVHITTDDGSKGKKGTVMAEVENLIDNVDAVYACGPEKMMEAVAKLANSKKKYCEVSIERYMKCGVGVCGSCAIDGKLCCIDGPVFNSKEAVSFKDFGKIHRDATGKKV